MAPWSRVVNILSFYMFFSLSKSFDNSTTAGDLARATDMQVSLNKPEHGPGLATQSQAFFIHDRP
jgi:hypothetical protein